jgi:peptidoglycan hydrolase-like protein with peptidoglycan-binding domain
MTKRRWQVLVGLAVAGVVTFVSLQSASASSTYLDGVWGDNDPRVNRSYNAHSSMAGAWQAVLYADGLLSCGSVDGWFGAGTEAATRTWQSRHGLDPDGRVGPATLARAFSKMSSTGGSNYAYNGSHARYQWTKQGDRWLYHTGFTATGGLNFMWATTTHTYARCAYQ